MQWHTPARPPSDRIHPPLQPLLPVEAGDEGAERPYAPLERNALSGTARRRTIRPHRALADSRRRALASAAEGDWFAIRGHVFGDLLRAIAQGGGYNGGPFAGCQGQCRAATPLALIAVGQRDVPRPRDVAWEGTAAVVGAREQLARRGRHQVGTERVGEVGERQKDGDPVVQPLWVQRAQHDRRVHPNARLVARCGCRGILKVLWVWPPQDARAVWGVESSMQGDFRAPRPGRRPQPRGGARRGRSRGRRGQPAQGSTWQPKHTATQAGRRSRVES
eukprot:3745064-Prymnesium_polylepis.1